MPRELHWHSTASAYGRRRTRHAYGHCQRRLRGEQLEDRRLLAIDVRFDAATGSLTLSDVNDQNIINLGVDDSGPQPELLVNDQPSGIATYDVRRIHVFGAKGNDVIDLSVVEFFTFPSIEDGNVFIYGGTGNDLIVGSGFADTIYAGAGNDRLHGGKGNDILLGQSGIDAIHGEQGNDTLSAGKLGRLVRFEIGGTAASPAGRGPVPVEMLSGGPGNDLFEIVSPDAASTIDIVDDSGVDTLDFSALNHGWGLADLDLSLPEYDLVAAAGRRTTLKFPPGNSLENVVGTIYADVIRGNAGNNQINGGAGDDRLEGGDGFDVLVGMSGNDALMGQAGNDILEGGVGNDSYAFAASHPGVDTISDEEGAADRLDFSGLSSAVRVDLTSPSLAESRDHGQFRIMLAAGQIEDVVGSEFDDIIQGNDSDNLLDGRGGDDLILAAGGNDTVFGGAGVDGLDPGVGRDFVDPGIGFDDPEVHDTPMQVVGGFSLVPLANAFNGAMYLATPSPVFPANATDKVVWSFDDLNAGAYELLATWVPDPVNAATNARFVVPGLLDRTVNQRLSPDGPRSLGFTWASLGQFSYGGTAPLEVELRAANGDGRIMADAVRLVRVGQIPQIATLPDLTISETDALAVPISVTYPLGALEDVDLALGENAPLGVVLLPGTNAPGQSVLTGTIHWPASAARESGSFLISVSATDRSHPTRRDEKSFWVTIGNPNVAPELTPIPPRTVSLGTVVSAQFSASDPDGPYWDLRYSLADDGPAGASIDPVSGWLSWDTSTAAAGTYVIGVMVSDDGNPPRSDRFDWTLNVLETGLPANLLAPGAQTAAEDASLAFSPALSNGLTVISSTSAELSLALVAADGTLVLPPAPGITYELGQVQPASHVKLRGSAAALNQALDGLTFTPTANFRGMALLRVELSDAGSNLRSPRLELAQIPITVIPSVDAPTVPSQILYFAPSPTPGALDVVGTVHAEDPDPDQWLSFRLVGGNGDFSIDSGTGRLIAAGDDVLPAGETSIQVQAFYELSPTHVGQGTITIHRVPDGNNDPYVSNDYYAVLEDQQLSGNFVLGDAHGGQADGDPDLEQVTLVSVSDVRGNLIAFDVPHKLPSGAWIVIDADGSFTFDGSASQQLDAGYFGTTLEDIRYTIADEHGATSSGGLASFSIDHVNDPHTLSPQTLSLAPTAAAGDRIGRVYVANAEPDEPLYFTILSGNTGNVFAIDSQSGELTLNSSTGLAAGQVFNLMVDVTDSEANGLTAAVSVQVIDNQAPVVPNAQYITAVDLPLAGHVFHNLTGNGPAFDPDGDSINIVAVNGVAFGVGRMIRLPSGTSLRLNGDGSFNFDPSTSLAFSRLAADDERVERIQFTTRDHRGASTVAELAIAVRGRNWAPLAFDNLYTLSDRDQLTGNVIDDFGVFDRRDRDQNTDELTLVSVNGLPVTDSLLFTSRRGAAVRVFADGHFVYDPADMDVTGLQPGQRLYDAFDYRVADEFGRTALAMARFEVEIGDAPREPFWISDVGLVNDTSSPGGSNHDDRSEDPRIEGTIAGTLGAAHHVVVELDVSAMAVGGTLQTPAELSVDASVIMTVGASPFPRFQFDPSTINTFGTYGHKTLAFRVKAFDQQDHPLAVSSWDYFQFEWLQMPGSGPIRLETIHLFNDTASIDDNGLPVGQDDLTTTDPRLYAQVGGNFQLPPLAGNDSREVRLEFTHVRAASVFTDTITIGSAQSVLYDPRTVDPGLNEDFSGTLAVDYTVNVVEVMNGITTVQEVAAGTVEFYYFSVPASCGAVTISEVPPAAGGYRGSIRDVIGIATWSCQLQGGQAFIEFDYADSAGNFDDLPDGDVGAVIDSSGEPSEARFEFTAIGLPGAQPRIRARVKHWSTEHGAYLLGDWSPALQLSELVPPAIASIGVAYEQPEGRDIPVVSGYLAGSVDDQPSGLPYELGAVGFVGLEFFHRDVNQFVFSDNWPVDGTSVTDALGRFDYRPEGLSYGVDYRIWARTHVMMPDGSAAYGAPIYLGQNVVLPAPILPDIEQLRLFDPSSAENVAGRWQTSDTRVAGSVLRHDDAGIAVQEVRIEFAHDYLNVSGDENIVAGIAMVESDGSFHYAPLLAAGDVDLRARVAFFDDLSGTTIREDWHLVSLPLSVVARINAPAVVEEFQLVDPISGSTGVSHTGTPKVSGRVDNPDGYAGHVRVEFRDSVSLAILGQGETDGSGSFSHTLVGLAPGPYSLDARAYDWNYLTQQVVAGPWTSGSNSLSFVLDAPAAFEVASFGLLSDTGAVPGRTANPALFGTVSGQGPFDHLAIAIDHGDNGTVDATVHPFANGTFAYFPDALPYGPHTFRAKLASWRSDQQAFVYSTGLSTTFTLEYQPNGPAQFAAIGLANLAATVTDPTLVGRIINEQQLEGVTIELDFDASDANGVNQTATTDELGQFTVTPWLAQAGPTSIRARTRELDAASAQYLTSNWYFIPTFNYQPVGNLPATLTLDLLNSNGGTPPVTADPTVFGHVQNDGSLDGVQVEFSWSANGPVIGTARVASSGYYEFEPGGLTSGQSVSLWARAREPLGQTGTQFQYGPPVSLQFVFSAGSANDLQVSEFALRDDTASPGGSTTADGSTEITVLVGSVTWSSGNTSGLTVELDVDGDLQPDDTVLTDAMGDFEFDPAPTEPGFQSVRARVRNPSFGASDWKVSNFVFDTNDSSPQALTLVNALSMLDSDWQSADDLDFATISDLANDLFALSGDNAESAYQFAATVARIVKTGIEQSVDRDYEQARRDAEDSFRQEVAVAQQAFLVALNALPVDQRPTYTLQEFVWPARPFGNELAIPAETGLPQPPRVPNYDGPDFDPFQDPLYRTAVWQAEQSYLNAVRGAEQLYVTRRDAPREQYRDDVATARQDYEAAIRQANADYEAARANSPDLDDTQFNTIANAISAVWRNYQGAWQSATDVWQSKRDRAVQRRDQAISNAWEDYWDASYCENDPPTIGGANACTDRAHAAWEDYDGRARRINAVFDRTMATADKQLAIVIADALHDAQVDAADLERQMAEIMRRHQHDKLVDSLNDLHDFHTNQAEASANLTSSLAQAEERKTKALADLVFDKQQQIADARQQRDQAISASLLNAVQYWSIAVGTPWAVYRADLAQLESIYRQQVIGFEYERDLALAGATRFEAHTIADARQDRSDGISDADTLRTSSLGELLRDFRINLDLEYTQRDVQLAGYWASYRTTMADAARERAIASADNVEDYKIAVADANEANHQPADVIHVRCIPNSPCAYPYFGFEDFVHQDNSDIRERNSRTHRRRVAAASRDRDLEQASIDQAFDLQRIDATETYRRDANARARDTTVAHANLRYSYHVDVASAQDDYNISVAAAVADYTVQLVVAQTGREYRNIVADQDYDDSTVVEKRALDNLSAARTRDFQIGQATAHLASVVGWSTANAGPWGTLQVNLAAAEWNRVAAVQSAAVSQARRSTTINVARIQADARTQREYAQQVFGSQGAYVQRASTIAQERVEMAENNALHEFVSAHAQAQKLHDIGVADDTLAYRSSVVNAESDRDQTVSAALRQRRRAVARANYAQTIDPENTDYFELLNTAYDDYFRRAADANLDLVLAREGARLSWKLAVGERRVQQVREIVAAQRERAEQLREDSISLASAMADAAVHWAADLAAAAAQRSQALSEAEASEAVYSADSAALQSYQLAIAAGRFQLDQAVAHSGYRVGLHDSHRLATQAYATAAGTTDAAYAADLAAIQYERAVQEATATASYYQSLANVQVAHQAWRSEAETNNARQTSATNVAYARQQAADDQALAVGMANALGALHLRTETAKADLSLGNAEAQSADIAYAEAARDRDNAIAHADYQRVLTIAPARADLTIACATRWWYWSEECQEEQEAYDEVNQEARETFDETKRRAVESFQRQVRAIETREDEDRAERREDYVTEIGDAKIALANRNSKLLESNTMASARNDAAKIFSLAAAAYGQTSLVAQADYENVLAAGQAQIAYQQQIRDAAVNEAFAVGAREVAYQVNVSAANAAAWQAIVAADPSNAYLRFRAAESTARAAWISQMSAPVAAYRGQNEAATRQAEVDARVLNATLESDEARADRAYRLNVAAAQQFATNSGALRQMWDATFAARNQNRLAIETAVAESSHALASVQADIRYQTALTQIEQQLAQDEDLDASLEARKHARYRYDASLANADTNWRTTMSSLEQAYAGAEALRGYQADGDQANLDRDGLAAQAAAENTRTLALAQAQADSWIDEATLTSLRRAQESVNHADLLSADHAARVAATGVLESTLSLPWASFERQRAAAQQAAWASIRDDYLALQQDASVQQTIFETARANRYLATTFDLAGVDLAYQTQRAELSVDMAAEAAGQQRAFAEALSREVASYRTSLAEAERVYDIAVAQARRDGTSTASANDDRTAAVRMAEDRYRAAYGQLSRTRREGVSQAGFQLTTGANLLQLQRTTGVNGRQAAFNSELVRAYYDPSSNSGLEAERASLQRAFVSLEAATIASALAGIPASPWAALAVAEASARRVHIVDPLAQLQANQRTVLAAARNEHYLAVTNAALTRSASLDQWDVWAGNVQAAGQFALVATFEDGQLPLPADLEPPTPDLGLIQRTTPTVAATYPEIQEIDYYGHPGTYAYWGENLWWGTTYADVWWLWSNYNYYDYGWSGLNYAGSYGYFGSYYYGGFGGGFGEGYYGYWHYSPWTFGWNGWSGGYVTPPTGLSQDFTINVAQTVEEFGQSVSTLTTHAAQTQAALRAPQDVRAPRIDGLAGSIQLVDTSTTFTAKQPIQSVGANGLADFTDQANTRKLDANAQGLSTLTPAVLKGESEPTGDATANGSSVAAEAYDFNIRFKAQLEGRAVYLEEWRIGPRKFVDVPNFGYVPQPTVDYRAKHLIGFVDRNGWVNFNGVGHGRARLTAVQKAASHWNSDKMQAVLRAAFAANPQLRSDKPQLQQLIDGVRSPYQLQETSNNIGIFIGGSFMHFYGVGNVERMYNQYVGTKFYYGGIGNEVDSLHPGLEGAFAWSEFQGNLDYMMADILRYGKGKEIHIFGWSRGAAQAAELARRLGGAGYTVSFVGMFDPVYSVDKPGQSSSLIRRSLPGKAGNYVTRDLAPNIQTAVAIYAVNEVRSWFPATYFEPENGSLTNLISIGSPGAHGEVGGHWQSNRYVQQLNYHVMMKYAEDYSSADFRFWDSNEPVTLDPQVKAIYESNYTTMAGLSDAYRSTKSVIDFDELATNYYESWFDRERWGGYSRDQFVDGGNSRLGAHWRPGKLSAQSEEDGGNNLAFAIEATWKRDAIGDWVLLGGKASDLLEQDERNHYKRHLGWLKYHLWDTYDGIDDDFMRELYEKVIDPDEGGWKT